MNTQTIDEIFWSLVDIKDPNTCWEWQGGKSRGYGVFSHYGKIKGDRVLAHRYALLGLQQSDTSDLVLHHCDNPSCCNPEHLYRGDYSDNLADRISRNPNNPGGRLQTGEVWLIRKLLVYNVSIKLISKMFKRSLGVISGVREGTRYNGVGIYHVDCDMEDRTWIMERHRLKFNVV